MSWIALLERAEARAIAKPARDAVCKSAIAGQVKGLMKADLKQPYMADGLKTLAADSETRTLANSRLFGASCSSHIGSQTFEG